MFRRNLIKLVVLLPFVLLSFTTGKPHMSKVEKILSSTNMALNKTAVASSIETDGTQAYKAFDGKVETRWASIENSNTAWVCVDLGSVIPISKVILKWELSYAKRYKIEVSNDAVEWRSIYTTANSNGDTDIISNLKISGRFVRMNATERGTRFGYSLLEFEVYDLNLMNVALRKVYKASSVETDGTQQNKAFDGDIVSRWGSKESSDLEWIYVDLGTVCSIENISLQWELAYAKSYQIQLSNDAVNWTTIYATTTGNGGLDEISGLTAKGRYVRMNATERGTEWGYSLFEFAVYGSTP